MAWDVATLRNYVLLSGTNQSSHLQAWTLASRQLACPEVSDLTLMTSQHALKMQQERIHGRINDSIQFGHLIHWSHKRIFRIAENDQKTTPLFLSRLSRIFQSGSPHSEIWECLAVIGCFFLHCATIFCVKQVSKAKVVQAQELILRPWPHGIDMHLAAKDPSDPTAVIQSYITLEYHCDPPKKFYRYCYHSSVPQSSFIPVGKQISTMLRMRQGHGQPMNGREEY